MNLVFTQDIFAGLSFKFTIKNLLEAKRELTYDRDLVDSYNFDSAVLDFIPLDDNTSYESYETFRSYSVSLSYEF
jgi:hypothetical protein